MDALERGDREIRADEAVCALVVGTDRELGLRHYAQLTPSDPAVQVREIVEVINEKMREANRKGIKGPPVVFRPFRVESVLRERRGGRPL